MLSWRAELYFFAYMCRRDAVSKIKRTMMIPRFRSEDGENLPSSLPSPAVTSLWSPPAEAGLSCNESAEAETSHSRFIPLEMRHAYMVSFVVHWLFAALSYACLVFLPRISRDMSASELDSHINSLRFSLVGIIFSFAVSETLARDIARDREKRIRDVSEMIRRASYFIIAAFAVIATMSTLQMSPVFRPYAGRPVVLPNIISTSPYIPCALSSAIVVRLEDRHRRTRRGRLVLFTLMQVVWTVTNVTAYWHMWTNIIKDLMVVAVCTCSALFIKDNKLRLLGTSSSLFCAALAVCIAVIRGLNVRAPHASMPPQTTVPMFLMYGAFVCVHASQWTKQKLGGDLRDMMQRKLYNQRRFIRFVFHEVRVPLNTISMSLDVMSLQPDGSFFVDGETARSFRQSIATVSTILNDVLTLEEMETGSMKFYMAMTCPADILDNARSSFSAAMRNKRITYRLSPSERLKRFKVLFDATRLSQAINNLISNAIKFTPEGGAISVSVDVRPNTSAPVQTCRMVITVEDSGCGFEPHEREDLFSAFVKLREGTKTNIKGSGLGLSICKAIVEAHKGTVDASSPGKNMGAKFVIHFPNLECMCDEPQLPPIIGPRSIVHTRAMVGRHFIVVDDSEVACRLMCRILESAGAAASRALNGQLGLNLYRSLCAQGVSVSGIITDLDMPVMDGASMAAAVREEGYTGPIIGVSGHALQEDANAMRDAGMNVVMTKPVSKEVVFARIAECMGP